RVVRRSPATAEEADQRIDAVVIRCDVVVANAPVVAEAVDASATEVVRTETQRDATPVVRPSAEHACAPPVERLARCHRVRLTVDLPAADASRSEEHTSELQSRENLVCRLLLEKKQKF